MDAIRYLDADTILDYLHNSSYTVFGCALRQMKKFAEYVIHIP